MNDPTITFEFASTGEIVSVEGSTQLNILAHAQLIERSLMSRCGGHAICGTCVVWIKSGRVSPIKPNEASRLAQVSKLPPKPERQGYQKRLACQCFPEPQEQVHVVVDDIP